MKGHIRIIGLSWKIILMSEMTLFYFQNDKFFQTALHVIFPLFSATKGDIHYAMEIENSADLCNIVIRRLDRQNVFHTKADELLNSKGESKSGLSDACNFNISKTLTAFQFV